MMGGRGLRGSSSIRPLENVWGGQGVSEGATAAAAAAAADLDEVSEAQHAYEQGREDEAGGIAHLPRGCAQSPDGHLNT